MIAQFKEDLCNKKFSLQDHEKVIKLILSRTEIIFGLISLLIRGVQRLTICIKYDHNDDGLDHSVRGAKLFPGIGELKKLLGLVRCK